LRDTPEALYVTPFFRLFPLRVFLWLITWFQSLKQGVNSFAPQQLFCPPDISLSPLSTPGGCYVFLNCSPPIQSLRFEDPTRILLSLGPPQSHDRYLVLCFAKLEISNSHPSRPRIRSTLVLLAPRAIFLSSWSPQY